MAQLLIDCPETGRPVATGWDLDWSGFEAAEIEPQTLDCPACGQPHRWTKEEAYLRADGAGD